MFTEHLLSTGHSTSGEIEACIELMLLLSQSDRYNNVGALVLGDDNSASVLPGCVTLDHLNNR